MESGGKMTAEERRKWIGVLLDKVLTIHEQGKHYVSLDINNLDYSIMVTVTAIKHGWGANRGYDFYKYCIMDLGTKELPVMVEYLDSLIEGEEVSE